MKKLLLVLTLSSITSISVADNLGSSASSVQNNSDYTSQRRIKIYQRTSAVINTISTGFRSSKSLSISVGDVTREQVQTTVSFRANGDVYKTVSLRQGDVIRFRVRNTRYRVTLVYLLNKPIGHDYVIFKIEQSPV